MSRNRALVSALLRHTKFSNIKKYYFTKSITYGSYTDYYDYNKIKTNRISVRDYYRKSKKGSKSDFSLTRARTGIFRIIESNINRHGHFRPIFFTLTTEDQISDLRKSNRKIKACIRRLKQYLKYSPKYLIVPERHENGAIHYHGVFFNVPYIYVVYFRKIIWTYGYVDLKLPRSIRRVSAYLAKYLTKETKDAIPKNEKTYFCSRGLIYPQMVYDVPKIHAKIYYIAIIKDGKIIKYKNVKSRN